MIACLDVDYRAAGAVAACVLFHNWSDSTAAEEITVPIAEVQEYQPGQFYKRELPCLLAVLKDVETRLDAIIIDGYVWLDDEDHPGLGAHLFAARNKATPIIGVAKTCYQKATLAKEITRGTSQAPLFVTAAGLGVDAAAAHTLNMHGPHRIPTLIKRADQLCRISG